MKIYKGVRIMPGYIPVIYVDDKVLDIGPSKLLRDYGADCPEWGYLGSGPSQTALAILYDAIGSSEVAIKYHQEFKRHFIANYDQNNFLLLELQIKNWLEAYIRNEGSNDYE